MGVARERVCNDTPSSISSLLKNCFNTVYGCLVGDQQRSSGSDWRQWRLCKKLLLFLQACREIHPYAKLFSEQGHSVCSFSYRFDCLSRNWILSFTESFCIQSSLDHQPPHMRDRISHLFLCWLSNELSIQFPDTFTVAFIRRLNEMKDGDLFLNGFFIPPLDERMKLFIKTNLCVQFTESFEMSTYLLSIKCGIMEVWFSLLGEGFFYLSCSGITYHLS